MDKSTGISHLSQPSAHPAQPEKTHQNSTATIRSINARPTPGLRVNTPSYTSKFSPRALSERTIKTVKPTSYLNRLYGAFNGLVANGQALLNVSKAFVSDFYATTAETARSAYQNIDQSPTELLKFTTGIAGVGIALTQAAAAGISEVAEKAGYQIEDKSIDGISYLLKKAGINTTRLSKSDIRHLSTSLAALQLGLSQDIDIGKGCFSMERPGYTLNISDIHLKGLNTSVDPINEKGLDQFSLSAKQLSFTLEYVTKTGNPAKIAVRIPTPTLTGTTNLLSVVGEAVAQYSQALPGLLAAGSGTATPDQPSKNRIDEKGSFLDRESTKVHFDADSVVVQIEKAGDFLADYGFPEGAEIAFHDVHTKQRRNFVGKGVSETPEVQFGLLEVDSLQAGPLQIKSGYLRLDDDLNGEMVVTLQANYSELEAYCPTWLPGSIKKAVTGTDLEKRHACVRVGIKVFGGVIDLNTLAASGLNKAGLNELQKLIQNRLIDTLHSEHTRLRNTDNGKELKIHVPIKGKARKDHTPKSGTNPQAPEETGNLFLKISQKLNDVKQKVESSSTSLGYKTAVTLSDDSDIFSPEQKGKGKISLLELLKTSGVNPKPR